MRPPLVRPSTDRTVNLVCQMPIESPLHFTSAIGVAAALPREKILPDQIALPRVLSFSSAQCTPRIAPCGRIARLNRQHIEGREGVMEKKNEELGRVIVGCRIIWQEPKGFCVRRQNQIAVNSEHHAVINPLFY